MRMQKFGVTYRHDLNISVVGAENTQLQTGMHLCRYHSDGAVKSAIVGEFFRPLFQSDISKQIKDWSPISQL